MQENPPQVYRPELISRRGEAIAWAMAVGLGAGWLILIWRGIVSGWIGAAFIVFHAATAGIISLGNWVDRSTRIIVDSSGIRYSNGLRKVALDWSQIQAVRSFPGRFGQTVQVAGKGSYFTFHTLAEVTLRSGMTNRMGFKNGEEIMRTIILNSSLQIVDQPGEGSYYTRQ